MEPLLIENVRLEIGEDDQVLTGRIAERLDVAPDALGDVAIVRRALDARRRQDVHWILHVTVDPQDEAVRTRALESGVAKLPKVRARDVEDLSIVDGVAPGARPLAAPPVIVGSGPAGLFAAWLLARQGYAPLVLDRGPAVGPRVKAVNAFDQGGPHDPEANILFGEGGAGTFSDGKLTSRSRTPLVGLVHDLLVAAKAPDQIKIDAKPHVGTDRLRAVLVFLRRELEALGCRFRFGARVEGLLLGADGAAVGVRLVGGEEIPAGAVLLGIGHSARDTYAALHGQGVAMQFKPFQMGLRIEHPQALVDKARFGHLAGRLPVAEYVLNDKKCGVFSFCMCPGGTLMASVSEGEHLSTNGMSRRRRDSGWANSGLVFTVHPEHLPDGGRHPLAGVELQRHYERVGFALGGGDYDLPTQRVPDFLRGKVSAGPFESSFPRGHRGADLREVLPPQGAKALAAALPAFGRFMPGYASGAGLLVGPESRGSSPVRIPRDRDTRVSVSTPGLYPIGEGAGYAGGIMSAALDGLRTAAALIRAHAPA